MLGKVRFEHFRKRDSRWFVKTTFVTVRLEMDVLLVSSFTPRSTFKVNYNDELQLSAIQTRFERTKNVAVRRGRETRIR